jgi:hypothetical protein
MDADRASVAAAAPLFGAESRSTASVRQRGATRIVAFFAIVGMALVATDALIDAGLKSIDTAAFGVFNRMVDGRINANILVTGSSRAVNHYDPREIAKQTGMSAWNLGVNGSQTDMQLAVLKTYLNHNAPPSLLIHNLDSFAFVTSRDGIAFADWYVPYLDQAPLYEALTRIDSDWQKAKYLPLYGYATKDMRFSWLLGVSALLGRSPREDRFDGFEPRVLSWTEDFTRFRMANPDGVRFPVEPEAVRDFEELVSVATTRGARVVLVYSPVYYEMQNLERGRAELFAQFEAIANRHGAAVWDYSDSPISRRREYFYNSQHLNAGGAAAFSVELGREVAASGIVAR